MKSIIKLFFLLVGFAGIFTACDRVDDLPFYGNGTAPVLSASSATIAPIAADSNKVALTLNWTNPNYATDSAKNKYIIEIDSATKNFSKPAVKVVTGSLTASYLAKELNDILLAKGYAFNMPVDMDVRVTSSYGNNNEKLTSNTLKIRMTPYKIPPKVALPTTNRLFITGADFGWSNTNPMPAYQELTRLSETQWGGIFHFTGGTSYLLLGQQGIWDVKYGAIGSNNSNNPAGDDFKNGGGDLASPSAAGDYKLIVDFQTGKFTTTKLANVMPDNLYITGDATAGGWSNTPPANQKFTNVTNGVFEITMALTPGKFYKFLTTQGQWQPQLGGSSATGGTLGANYGGGQDPDAVPTPTTAGNYKITVNFITNTYTVVKL